MTCFFYNNSGVTMHVPRNKLLVDVLPRVGLLPLLLCNIHIDWLLQGDGHAWHRATHAFMARFRTKHELRQFVASAPVQALQRSSSAGLPFALELLLAFDIEPPKKSKAVPPPKL